MAELMARLQDAVGGGYRIEQELGGGGMSRVFLAREVRLGRTVVIKVLPPEMAAGVSVERFEREIQLAARLQHPHIVPLLTAGSSEDLLYSIMRRRWRPSTGAWCRPPSARPMAQGRWVSHGWPSGAATGARRLPASAAAWWTCGRTPIPTCSPSCGT